MRRTGARRAGLPECLGFVVAIAAAALLLPSQQGAAQSYRQFTGRIEAVDTTRVIVESRKGDRVSFERTPESEVTGQGKGAWEDLARGDRVAVSWLLRDEPRKAHRVVVMPPLDEE